MTRPRLLDLYCGAGGAGKGYELAGFDVTGVDIVGRSAYPFDFIKADALALPLDFLQSFDAIHASPPCQAHTAMKAMHNAKPHADLIPPTRAMLQASGKPWIIENVVGAPMENPVMLCGTMFGLHSGMMQLRRHRLFEGSFPLQGPACEHREGPTIGIYGGHIRDRRRNMGSVDRGLADPSFSAAKRAMGIDWMTVAELCQAIPPAYTRFLGAQLLRQVGLARWAA